MHTAPEQGPFPANPDSSLLQPASLTAAAGQAKRTLVKGCAFFAALFLLGFGLVIGGFVYEVMYAGLQFQDPTPASVPHGDYAKEAHVARVIKVSGVAVAFGAIFGAAAWGFFRRVREGDGEDELSERRNQRP